MAKGWLSGTWSHTGADYLGNQVRLTIPYDTTTLNIVNPGLTCVRDPGCLLDTLVLGRPGGIVEEFPIPEGTTVVGRAQLSQQGFQTIDNVTEVVVTFRVQGG